MRCEVGVHRPGHVWGSKGYEYAVRFHVGLRCRTGRAAPQTVMGCGSAGCHKMLGLGVILGKGDLDRGVPREKQGRQNSVLIADEFLIECTKT